MGLQAWVAAALVLVLSWSGPASATEVLRVGTSGDYPPFSIRGEGFDVEIARRLAADLGMRIEWVPFRWSQLAARLQDGDFDVAMSGVTWRPDREIIAPMSRAVAVGGPCVVGSPGPRRLAVNRGGFLERWASERFPRAALVAVDDNLSLPDRLAAGAVDAFVTDSFEVVHFARRGWPVDCEPKRDRKAYWIAPARAADLAPRIDAWLAGNESAIDALRERWLGGRQPRSEADHLVDLVARRLELMPLVAASKRARGGAIADPERELSVLVNVANRAEAAGVDPQATGRLYRQLITLAKAVQARSPGATPVVADLETGLRPAISRLDDRIVKSLAVAAPIGESSLAAERFAILDRTLRPDEIGSLRAALRDFSVSPSAAAGRSQPGFAIAGSDVSLLGDGPTLLNVGAGAFDLAHIGGTSSRAGTSAGGQVELRIGRKLFYVVGPVVGVLANSDGGVMGYGGGALDFAWNRLRVTPVLSLGAWEEGDSKLLGGVFQFHVGASGTYEMDSGLRVGVTFAHISNAFIHDRNPGTEFLLLSAMIPLGF